MAKLFSDIFKPGWSTSKPGDMKNPSHMGMDHISDRMPHLAKPSLTTSVKPSGVFTTALEKMEADERHKLNQEKLRKDFAAMLAATGRYERDQDGNLVPPSPSGPLTTGQLRELAAQQGLTPNIGRHRALAEAQIAEEATQR